MIPPRKAKEIKGARSKIRIRSYHHITSHDRQPASQPDIISLCIQRSDHRHHFSGHNQLAPIATTYDTFSPTPSQRRLYITLHHLTSPHTNTAAGARRIAATTPEKKARIPTQRDRHAERACAGRQVGMAKQPRLQSTVYWPTPTGGRKCE